MKKKAERWYPPPGTTTIGAWCKCPFCGEPMNMNRNMPWCSGCFVEWYEHEDPNTYESSYIFDDKRKTERFALAKAIGRTGGMKIGG